MATKIMGDLGPVEVQTQVVVVAPSGVLAEAQVVIEGLSLWEIVRYLNRAEGAYLKVVSDWICPKCNLVHGDQLDLDSECDLNG